MRPRGRVKLQGQVAVFTARGGPGSQVGPFRFPPTLAETGWGVVQRPKPDPVGVRPFRPAWGGNCGLCFGVWSVRWGSWGLGGANVSPNVKSTVFKHFDHQTKRDRAIYQLVNFLPPHAA